MKISGKPKYIQPKILACVLNSLCHHRSVETQSGLCHIFVKLCNCLIGTISNYVLRKFTLQLLCFPVILAAEETQDDA